MAARTPIDALTMSRIDCLKEYVQYDGNRYDKIVVGAVILRSGPCGESQVLVVKRAVHEHFYPNIWEIPGGKVEASDLTILDAVKREVLEETSLQVDRVIGMVKSFDYFVEKKVPKGGGETSTQSASLQLNFVCTVTNHDVCVNPEEHAEARWVGPAEVMELEMTEKMREVVDEALKWVDGHTTGR
ncbi:MAG: hypothetical protein Q9219_003518 [cf. Caloplaca sp. 3 TL-2023]